MILAALVAAALVVAGCGGSSSDSGGSGEPASLAPADVPFYFEADLAPGAKTSEELDQLADTVQAISDLAAEGVVDSGNGMTAPKEAVDINTVTVK